MWLEKCGVVHRDLHPWNLLIDRDDRVIICDFGSAGIFINTNLRTRKYKHKQQTHTNASKI